MFENYGFDIRNTLDSYDHELFNYHNNIFLIPLRYLEHFSTLPFAYLGMTLGRWMGDSFEPSHEFISRFGHEFSRGRIQIHQGAVAQWVAGRDIRYPTTNLPAKGQYLLVTDQDGRNLGMGKLLPKRLRNMLPRQSI